MPQDAIPTPADPIQNSHVPIWAVTVSILGPIKVRSRYSLLEPKNSPRSDLFYTNLLLQPASEGVGVSVEARAETASLAGRAALVFVGQMLDVLALQVDLPLRASLGERHGPPVEGYAERRIMEKSEWHVAFEKARILSYSEPSFLRALGWYRKGLYTEDPFDRFLAYWNSIEVVAGKYHVSNEETKKGSKNQILDCFTRLWGDPSSWPVVQGDRNWISANYNTRKDIAHGLAAVTVHDIETVFSKINSLKQVAYAFLKEWQEKQLRQIVPPDLRERFGPADRRHRVVQNSLW